MNGYIKRWSVIRSCQSADTSEVVKRYWAVVYECARTSWVYVTEDIVLYSTCLS